MVDPFVDTVIRLGCEVPKERIFYSSGEDTGVPSGHTLNEYIRSQTEMVALVVAIISPTFQTRPFCVAELGAAWSQVGKLFPIAVPGLQRTDMQGVLTGLAVRYLSDSAALDELHDHVCNLLGTQPGAKTWGRYKNQWLASVDEYAQRLPRLREIIPEDYDRAVADLQGTRDALREAEATIREQKVKLERLASAKSADEVTEIMLPKGERERFDALLTKARDAFRKVPVQVGDAMWYRLSFREMPGPDSSRFHEVLDAGWLRAGPNHEGFVPNEAFGEVRAAAEAIEQLNDFFRHTRKAFDDWFNAGYHVPPDLTLKRVWDKLFPSFIFSSSDSGI